MAAACGGYDSPTMPAPVPSPRLSIIVTPNPLRATLVRVEGDTSTVSFAADISITESAGIAGTVDQVTTVVTSTRTTEQGGSFSTTSRETSAPSVQFVPLGTVTYTHTQQIGLAAGETVTWHLEVSGVDGQSRRFTASSVRIPITVVTSGS